MTLKSTLAPTYLNMLRALSAWLDKASTEAPDRADQLLASRLAPDMYPLSTQVRFACVQALEGMHRLAGVDFPSLVDALLEEGRGASDAPGNMAAAKARIGETLALVEAMTDDPETIAPDEPLPHAIPAGMTFDLTAEQYVRDWALAQFYFHVMTAYAILRHEGISLGKRDYAAHMFPYLRQPVTSA